MPVESFCDLRRDCHDASDEWALCDNCTYSAALIQTQACLTRDGRFECVPLNDTSPQNIVRFALFFFYVAVTSSQCAALQCAVGCRPTHAGLACYCKPGFEPMGSNCVGEST